MQCHVKDRPIFVTYRMGYLGQVSALNQVLSKNFLKSDCLIYWSNRLLQISSPLSSRPLSSGQQWNKDQYVAVFLSAASNPDAPIVAEWGRWDCFVHSLFTCHTMLDSGALNDCWASNMFSFTVTWPHLNSLVAPFLASDPCRSM